MKRNYILKVDDAPFTYSKKGQIISALKGFDGYFYVTEKHIYCVNQEWLDTYCAPLSELGKILYG